MLSVTGLSLKELECLAVQRLSGHLKESKGTGVDQRKIPFSQRKSMFSVRFLVIYVPSHSPYMTGVADTLFEEDLGGKGLWTQQGLRIPVFHTEDSSNSRTNSGSLTTQHLHWWRRSSRGRELSVHDALDLAKEQRHALAMLVNIGLVGDLSYGTSQGEMPLSLGTDLLQENRGPLIRQSVAQAYKTLGFMAAVQQVSIVELQVPPKQKALRGLSAHLNTFCSLQVSMDSIISYDALVIPSDDRAPHLASLMTSPLAFTNVNARQAEVYRAGRMPHPEILMDYIAEGLGPRGWRFQLLEALEGMNKKFDQPYIIFFPVVSRDGLPFPINKDVKDLQDKLYQESKAWRGNLIIAKYSNLEYSEMKNISMADFPLVKNYLSTHGCNQGSR
ncbi:hypothetical protein NM688_g6147 [Phlebia brevispora]|uniref:Uncharacterized protein n=1 Tax=Phlebia brevispora TaxID=194682 RepID=A0ACC1SJB8_9APHY|nr:hypothetical protein NM688_g6147 [Phlebia brevispora]